MGIVRGVGAVLLGYTVFAAASVALFVLTGRDAHAAQDTAFTVLALGYGMLCAALGGYLAARVAGRRPLLHAGVVAGMIALGAAASIPSVPEGTFPWTQIGALLLMAPSALLGGWLCRRGTA